MSSVSQEIPRILWSPVGSLPHSQKPATSSYPKSSPRPCEMYYDKFLRRSAISTTPNHGAGRQSLVGCPKLLIQRIRSYLPYLGAVPASAHWGRTTPWWWQRPAYHGLHLET